MIDMNFNVLNCKTQHNRLNILCVIFTKILPEQKSKDYFIDDIVSIKVKNQEIFHAQIINIQPFYRKRGSLFDMRYRYFKKITLRKISKEV